MSQKSSYSEILNNPYIGAAMIFSIEQGRRGEFSVLDVNEKYIREVELNIGIEDFLKDCPIAFTSEAEKEDFYEAAMKAAKTGEEVECIHKCKRISTCCDDKDLNLATRIVFIEKCGEDLVFFAESNNSAKIASNLDILLENERKFKISYEQINIYSWEYTIEDHTMRPCFRCMRDLGLPPIVENYPDTAIEEGIFPQDYADMYRDWHVQLANGAKELEAIIPLTPDRVPFRVRYTAEYDSEGRPYKAYGSATLVTDDELRAKAEAAEVANKAKTEFLSNMSHDIRTPMNAIVGFTSLAKMNIDDREQTLDYLGKIESANELLLGILNDILDISRIESGALTLSEERVDIVKEAGKIKEMFCKLAEDHEVSLEYDLTGVKDTVAYGDPVRLDQIIMNLVSNAVKYGKKGGHVRYTIDQTDSDKDGYNRYVFTVRDDGIGMSKEFLSHVFDMFAREKNSTMSKVPGTGLGMAIIKRLVTVMDGDITIDSEPGKGTTVTVTLDLKAAPAKGATDNNADNKQGEASSLEGKCLLVVDDQSVNRVIVKQMLSRYGVVVEEAQNGTEAVRIVTEKDPYDIILMDVQMPEMDGYEATKQIRSIPDAKKASVPILALTADAFAEDKITAINAGMNAHIAKPIDMNTLVEAVREYI